MICCPFSWRGNVYPKPYPHLLQKFQGFWLSSGWTAGGTVSSTKRHQQDKRGEPHVLHRNSPTNLPSPSPLDLGWNLESRGDQAPSPTHLMEERQVCVQRRKRDAVDFQISKHSCSPSLPSHLGNFSAKGRWRVKIRGLLSSSKLLSKARTSMCLPYCAN